MRRKKKGIPKTVKTLPLAVAIAALSAGSLSAAAADAEVIQITTPDGKVLQYDLTTVDGADQERMKQQLKEAFESGESIKVSEDGSTWVEFSEHAAQATLEEMLTSPLGNDWSTLPETPDAIY